MKLVIFHMVCMLILRYLIYLTSDVNVIYLSFSKITIISHIIAQDVHRVYTGIGRLQESAAYNHSCLHTIPAA